MSTPLPAFDAMACAYDREFTATVIGAMMRKAVRARCAARFSPGSRVLEMNCGTGEDAMWLASRGIQVLATDISPAMLRVAQSKLPEVRAIGALRFERLAWEDLAASGEGRFDGALSNFGGLNCVQDLRRAAQGLASKLRAGASAVLCIMGPAVPWEWVWFLARGNPKKAFRRLRREGASWGGITIHYPSIADTSRAFAPEFKVLRVAAIGALLPPPYAENWMGSHPRLLAALNRWERRLETVWPFPMLADHYLMELERV